MALVLAPALGMPTLFVSVAGATAQDLVVEKTDMELGKQAYGRGDLDKALGHFKSAVEAVPRSAEGPFWLGRTWGALAYRAEGTWQKMSAARQSRSAFEVALGRDPNHGPARLGLVRYYVAAPAMLGGSRAKAEEQARDLEGRHGTWGALAWAAIYEKFGSWQEAAQFYERAASLGALEEEAYLRWAWLLQSHRRFAEAFRALDELQRHIPSSAMGLYEVGRTAAFSGLRLQEGRSGLTRYLHHTPTAGQPSAAQTRFYLGMIRRHEGRDDLARDEFRRALELDSSLQEARQNLQELAKPTPTN